MRWGFGAGGVVKRRTFVRVGGAHSVWFLGWENQTGRGRRSRNGRRGRDDDVARTLVLAFFTAFSSISTPTPLAPAFAAAVTSTLPSLHPRSYTTSAAVTPATASISSTIFWGVALMGPR